MPDLERPSGFDVVRVETRFPVVESTQMQPLKSGLFRRARRDPQDLPQLAEGSTLVFHTNDGYVVAPEGPKMLASDVVLKATMVSVVLTRAHEVNVVAQLTPGTTAGRLMLRASFNCKVDDPVRVLDEGCWDVRPSLRAYLLDDPKLMMLGARIDVLDNADVIPRILARTFARKKLEPPMIPGMRVQLIDVSLAAQGVAGGVPIPRRSAEDVDLDIDVDTGYVGRDRDRDRFDDAPRGGPRRDRYDD